MSDRTLPDSAVPLKRAKEGDWGPIWDAEGDFWCHGTIHRHRGTRTHFLPDMTAPLSREAKEVYKRDSSKDTVNNESWYINVIKSTSQKGETEEEESGFCSCDNPQIEKTGFATLSFDVCVKCTKEPRP